MAAVNASGAVASCDNFKGRVIGDDEFQSKYASKLSEIIKNRDGKLELISAKTDGHKYCFEFTVVDSRGVEQKLCAVSYADAGDGKVKSKSVSCSSARN